MRIHRDGPGLLCALGLHQWSKWTLDVSDRPGNPHDSMVQFRFCARCWRFDHELILYRLPASGFTKLEPVEHR